MEEHKTNKTMNSVKSKSRDNGESRYKYNVSVDEMKNRMKSTKASNDMVCFLLPPLSASEEQVLSRASAPVAVPTSDAALAHAAVVDAVFHFHERTVGSEYVKLYLRTMYIKSVISIF